MENKRIHSIDRTVEHGIEIPLIAHLTRAGHILA